MITADRILVTLPPSGSARLSSLAAGKNIPAPEMAARLLVQAAEKKLALPPPPARAAEEPPVTLDIARALSPEERRRLDTLALSHGTSPEALAAETVRRLLKRKRQPVQTFRLKNPRAGKAEAGGARGGPGMPGWRVGSIPVLETGFPAAGHAGRRVTGKPETMNAMKRELPQSSEGGAA